MNIYVRFAGIDSPEPVRAYAERRILIALDRVLGVGATALVRLSDLNGPRGGMDKRCRITVREPGFTAQAEAIDGDPFTAIDRACGRMARILRDDRAHARAHLRRGRGSVREALDSGSMVHLEASFCPN